MSKAYSYLRFSTPEQQKGDSYRRQSKLAADYATQHGLELDDTLTFHDLGVSAYRGKNAEAGRLGDFLAAVDDGLVPPRSTLLVESLDRISRQFARRALRVLEDIVDRGVAVVTLGDGRRYTKEALDGDPMSLLLAILTFIRANEESAMKASRLQAAWLAKRAKAAEKPLTAVCPAWLRLDGNRFVLIEERAAIVRRVFTEAAAGKGQHAIAEGLNKDRVPTFGHRGRQGMQWHRTYVAKLLASPPAIGTYVPHRMDYSQGKLRRLAQEAVPDYYPPVVDRELWEQVQAIRTGSQQPLRGRHAHAGVIRNVFGGLARCTLCGSTVTRITKGSRWIYLVCTKAKGGAGCSYRLVPYGEVEQALLKGADQVAYQCPTGNPEADRAAREVDALDDQISVLQDDITRLVGYAGRARSPAIAQQVVDLEAAIEETRRRQGELGRMAAVAKPERIEARLAVFKTACRALEEALGASARADDAVDPDGALRAAVNAALRALCGSVEVDHEQGELLLRFLHGGSVALTYSFRSMQWPA